VVGRSDRSVSKDPEASVATRAVRGWESVTESSTTNVWRDHFAGPLRSALVKAA